MATKTSLVSCKVVLLGDSGVGKTSLANRWISSGWNSAFKPTIGANHQRKRIVINNDNVDIFLWDTAGQEQFRSLAPVYTRSASAVLIVASLNDIHTFESIQSWIDIVKTTSEEIPPLILLANKEDLDTHCIKEEEIHEKYHDLFQSIYVVSALTGKCVDDAFQCASEAAYHFFMSYNEGVTNKPIIAASTKKGGCC